MLVGWLNKVVSSSQASKVLAKYELLKVPLIGWTWYFLEIVFCKRKWEEDRDTVFKGLTQLKDYPEFMWVSKTTNRNTMTFAPLPLTISVCLYGVVPWGVFIKHQTDEKCTFLFTVE
jgi:hypothetical protein